MLSFRLPKALKSIFVLFVLPTKCIFCPPALSTTRIAVIGKAMQEEYFPALFGEAIDDGDFRLELAHLAVQYSGLALPSTVHSNCQGRMKCRTLVNQDWGRFRCKI